MIRGIELTALGKTRSFELVYESGQYRGPQGKPVDTLVDMACYACGNAYYTLDDDFLEFCPHCGSFERRSFATLEELAAWAREQDWSFTKKIAESYFAVFVDGAWGLRPARSLDELQRSRRYHEVRELISELLSQRS